MDRDAIDRIIDAVGAEDFRKRKSPKDLGRKLDWAKTCYCTNDHLQVSNAAREKRLSAALKDAKRLQLALDGLEDQGDLLTTTPRKELGTIVQLLQTALAPPAPKPEWQRKAAKKVVKELHLNKRSAFEWLVGIELPQIFKKFFRKLVGFSRGAAPEAGGPYIRFAEQALIELGITRSGKPYKAEAIAKALADARKGRSRRKLGKVRK